MESHALQQQAPVVEGPGDSGQGGHAMVVIRHAATDLYVRLAYYSARGVRQQQFPTVDVIDLQWYQLAENLQAVTASGSQGGEFLLCQGV